jgi:hypothetical protein
MPPVTATIPRRRDYPAPIRGYLFIAATRLNGIGLLQRCRAPGGWFPRAPALYEGPAKLAGPSCVCGLCTTSALAVSRKRGQ